MVDELASHGTRILAILAVFLAVYIAVGRTVPKALAVAMGGARGRDLSEEEGKRLETLSRVLVHAAGVTGLVMTALMVLAEVRVNIAPVLAGAGLVGLAIAFGAQSLVKDVISGFFILIEDQYSKGDVVAVGGATGLVGDFNFRRTILRDLDGTVHYVPNGEIRVASNLSKDFARVNLNISIAYHEDIDRAVQVINRVGQELAVDERFSADVIEAPAVLRIDDLADSGVVIKVLGVTERLRQWDISGELRRRIKLAFNEDSIEIPFPHVAIVPRGDLTTATAGNGRENQSD